MTTLITGGTGFVGANLVKDLASNGHTVVSMDLSAPDSLMHNFISEVASNISFVTGDILDQQFLDNIQSTYKIDRIIHAAVYTVNQLNLEIERSREIIDINVMGTTNLLELARKAKVKRFLYISSGAAYGLAEEPDQTFNETSIPQPDFLYGITKYTSELLTRRYSELYGFSSASIRLSTPFGPMERVTNHRGVMSVFHQWTRSAIKGNAIEVSNPHTGRDYTYISDIADGVRTVLDAPELAHDLFNVTAGRWIRYSEILESLRRIIPTVDITVTNSENSVGRSSEPSRGPLSGHRLTEDLGWTPQYDLDAGLNDYINWRKTIGYLD